MRYFEGVDEKKQAVSIGQKSRLIGTAFEV